MSADDHLGESVAPDRSASLEQRNQTDVLVDVLNQLPTISEREFRKEHEPRQHDGVFADEWSDQHHRMKYEPVRAGLPGFGEEMQPDCGVQIPHVCEDCGKRIDIGRTCAQSRCQRCAPSWVMRRAEPIVARILSSAKMKEGSQKLHHVSVDPPDLLVDAPSDKEPEDVLIDRLQAFCRRIEFDGLIAFHPWRGADAEDPAAAVDPNNDDRGEWKKRLFNGRDWESVRDELQFSPHFHMVGSAEWFPGGDQTRRIWDETGGEGRGWLFERITPRGRARSINGPEELARAVCYCLSHVGIDTRGEANRYVHGKVGSAYHNASGRYHQKNVRIAKAAIRDVAAGKGSVLGLQTSDVECRGEVLEEQKESELDHDHETEQPEENSDGEESEVSPSKVPCRSGLTDIDSAEFVDSTDWQMQALYADEAIQARREWQDAGGWQGWQTRHTGQAVLPERGTPAG